MLHRIAFPVVSEWCQLAAVNLLKIHALAEEAQRDQQQKSEIAASPELPPQSCKKAL